MSYVLENRVLVTVTFDLYGPIADSFDRWDGGDVDSTTKQYHPGGGADPVAVSGTKTVSDVTISRGYRADRDAPLRKWLRAHVGAWATLGYQPLNPDNTPVAAALETSRAILRAVTALTADSEGDNVLMMPVVFTVHGLPS